MTTNVYCKKSSIVASDSRWSIDVKPWGDYGSVYAVIFTDESGYDKICCDIDSVYIFAGNSRVIDAWKKWAKSDQTEKRPNSDGIAVCVIEMETNDIIFEHGQDVRDLECRMAGTGAKHAYECWRENNDPKKAVFSAMSDTGDFIYSGGEIKFQNLATKESNVNTCSELSDIQSCILEKGKVRYMTTTTNSKDLVSLQEAAANDPNIKSIVGRISAGTVSANAPNGFDPVIWTPEDEKRLDEAFAKRAEKRLSLK